MNRIAYYSIIILGLGVALIGVAIQGEAHPLGNFSLNHFSVLDVQPNGFGSQHILDFAETPSYTELLKVDTDNNNIITPEEIKKYKEFVEAHYLPNFIFRVLDEEGIQKSVTPRLERHEISFSRGEGSITCLQIIFVLSYTWEGIRPQNCGVFFQDDNFPHIRGTKEILIVQHQGIAGDAKVVALDSDVPVRKRNSMWRLPGVDAYITFHVESEQPDRQIQYAWAEQAANPMLIPQYPLEADAEGNYTILKSPIEADTEVQSKIASLQPRRVMDATALLGVEDASPALEVDSTMSGGQSRHVSEWSTMIGAEDLSPSVVLFAVLVSILAGASHALSPGHGKTVVAAYLIGSRGTVWHAVFLGLIVTLTHVSSVIVLGLITLYGSQYIVPDTLFPIIECASGLIIVAMGLTIFWKRFGAYQRLQMQKSLGITSVAQEHHHHDHSRSHPNHPHPHPHDPIHDHEHEHEAEFEHVHAHSHETENQAHSHDHGHSHHDHEHPHDHNHSHSHHDHDHPHEHKHLHEDGHSHSHWGIGQHTHDIPENATWRELLILGITGGIVPCPTAIMVLLAAIALHKVLFGMLLIVFFSIGLAVVLIAIGVLMVTARRFFDKIKSPDEKIGLLQIVSPVLVTILGLVIVARGLISANVISINL